MRPPCVHIGQQEEVAACLGVGLDSLVDRTTPFSMHVAQLADFRFQLRCMLRKAKDLVSVRQNSEERVSNLDRRRRP